MPKNCAALDLSRRLRMGGSYHEFLPLALSIAISLTTAAAYAGGENFDAAKPGTLPEDWICGVTGKGSPTWKVEADTSAPSQPNVLKQSGSATFPCVSSSQCALPTALSKSNSNRSPGARIKPAASCGASKTGTTITSLEPTRSRTMFPYT